MKKIGYVCKYARDFELFAKDNIHHKVVKISRFQDIVGRQFDLILYGYGWRELSPHLLIRIEIEISYIEALQLGKVSFFNKIKHDIRGKIDKWFTSKKAIYQEEL
jgi:hypothetical protein